jgi:hypothetical protein
MMNHKGQGQIGFAEQIHGSPQFRRGILPGLILGHQDEKRAH